MTKDKILSLEFIYQNIFYENETIVHKVIGNMQISYASELLRDNLNKTLSYIFKTDKIILTTQAEEQLNSILNIVKEELAK